MTSRILVVGNDKFGNKAINVASKYDNLLIVVDRSTSWSRILRLVRRRVLSLLLVSKMFICEKFRKGDSPTISYLFVKSNKDLIGIIEKYDPDEVILFRAGLIINKNLLSMGPRFLNIHCSRLPDYGGIGTINRALINKDLNQSATMHLVTSKIDEGKIIKTLPYLLDPEACYCKNEDVAYSAGLDLLDDYLRQQSMSSSSGL